MIKLKIKKLNTCHREQWHQFYFKDREEFIKWLVNRAEGLHTNLFIHLDDFSQAPEDPEERENWLFNHTFGGLIWDNEKDQVSEEKAKKWLKDFKNYNSYKKEIKQQGALKFLINNENIKIFSVNDGARVFNYILPKDLNKTRPRVIKDIICYVFEHYDRRLDLYVR